MNSILDKIRLKVWDGESLSEQEFDDLKKAVQNRASPELHGTLVQALVNADAVDEALSLVNRLLSENPYDAQLHIGKARALMSKEEYGEAEVSLKSALKINPNDPEVLKALVVIWMRRGEFLKAKKTIEEMLREDPLDSEAQQLSLELESAEVKLANPNAQKLQDPQFRGAVVSSLKARSIPFLIQGDNLLIRSGKSTVARLVLSELQSDFETSGHSLDSYADSMATELSERTLGIRPGKLHLLSKVLPLLREPAFLESAVGAVHREGPAGLLVFYVIEDPSFARYVPERALAKSQLELDELDAQAFQNLESIPVKLKPIELVDGALKIAEALTGLWGLTGNDGHDAARLLVPKIRREIESQMGPGRWRVYLGLRELVLLCREDNLEMVEQLETLQAADNGIAGRFEIENGILQALASWPQAETMD